MNETVTRVFFTHLQDLKDICKLKVKPIIEKNSIALEKWTDSQ